MNDFIEFLSKLIEKHFFFFKIHFFQTLYIRVIVPNLLKNSVSENVSEYKNDILYKNNKQHNNIITFNDI